MIFGGIDAGGTSSRCILIDGQGKVIAMGKAGPANYQIVGLKAAVSEVSKSLQLALTAAGITQVDVLGIGMAGVGRPDDRAMVLEELRPMTGAKELYLTDDGEIAVLGAHAGKPGVVVIAGTGSIVYGLKEDGTMIRSGGWGPLLGDEGSGFWMGLSALKAVIKAQEKRGPTTSLTGRFLKFLGITELHQLIPLIYQKKLPRKMIASLTPLVIDAMSEEDGVARRIVEQGLDELVLSVQAVYSDLESSLELAVSGGLFSNPLILELFVQKLKEAGDYHIIKPGFSPVHGAVFFGAQKVGWQLENLEGGIDDGW